MSDRISFCAVPYVTTEDPGIAIGDFTLWPNTPENWVKYTGQDWSAHMEQYQDRQIKPVGKDGSVLTHKDVRKTVSREDFRDVVVCFSTAAWLLGDPLADSWLLETWNLSSKYNPKENIYERLGKFQYNLNSADYDRLIPNPYMFRVAFNPIGAPGSINHSVLQYVTGELLRKREESTITAMHRFHRIRQATPYYNSIGDDLEGLWSGFEALFKAPLTTKDKNGDVQYRWEWIFDRIKDEFSPEETLLKAEFWAAMKEWARKTYEFRSMHTHGHWNVVTDIKLADYQPSLFYIGLKVAYSILSFRAYMRSAENEFILHKTIDILNGMFCDYPNADKVITYIKQKGNKSFLSEAIPSDVFDAILSVANTERTIGKYENENKLLSVLQTINLTLSAFTKKLPSMGLDINNAYCQALLELPNIISRAAEQIEQNKGASTGSGYEKKKTHEQLVIHRATLKFLEEKNIHKPYLYSENNINTLENLKIGQVSVWILAALYMKLRAMF